MPKRRNEFTEQADHYVGITRRGQTFPFDKSDYRLVSDYCWHLTREGYVQTKINQKSIMLHRLILNVAKGAEVDHINHKKDDCRRANLRICQRKENMRNRIRQRNNSSGFKGVTKNREKWLARIKVDGKHIHLGLFDTAEDAHAAYMKAATRFHGEYACTG